MPDKWQINGTATNGLAGQQPTLTPGDSGDYTFGFYSVVGEPTTHVSRYETVLGYGDFAGQFYTYETIEGDIYWRESRPGTSQLVHLVPPDDSPTGRGLWGLIESVEDATTLSQARCELTLSIVKIASGSEFETEADIRTAREVHGP
jgi:hypothetical protein